jgi:phosphatidylserine/phosphatidylglycerophosphate/cardiolipin synthase-like enzyme
MLAIGVALVHAAFLMLPAAPEADTREAGTLELVESVPSETTLDLPAVRNATAVWREMIKEARRAIDIETFYMSTSGTGADSLEAVLDCLAEAAARGVVIRVLVDAGFIEAYPEVVARLEGFPGAAARTLDARGLWGGVLHAKFFVVDGAAAFVGSQNWDWRALEHIRELGVRIADPGLAQALQAIFEMDWSLAGDMSDSASEVETVAGSTVPAGGGPFSLTTERGQHVSAVLAASPPDALPAGVAWDESLLVQVIDATQEHVRLQLLTFNPVDRAGMYHDALECALRRAAARGVRIRIILSDWNTRESMLPYVLSLTSVPGIEVRFTTIPEWTGGFIPYARVEHAKYLVADDDACWIGTSNWTRGGFHNSRNISVFIRGKASASDAIEFFEKSWHSDYADDVDPCRTYEAPRIGE